MRYSMWTPLPPERSGIADYSYELLESLTEVVDLDVVVRDPAVTKVPAGARVVEPGNVAPGVNIYQMGNHAGVHSWIYRQALAEPGIVVLHDTSLLDFHVGYFGGTHQPEFRAEVGYAHGPIWGDPSDPALCGGWPALDVDGVRVLDGRTLSMERRLAAASLGMLVHDPHSVAQLRARYPRLPVYSVPSGAPVRDDRMRAAIRSRFGWQDEHLVFGVFGGFHRNKRILVVALAFAQVRRRWPNARLLLAGHVDQPDVYQDVVSTFEQLGLADSVHVALSPPKDEFEDLISATDAVVNLRWPTAGETSATMIRTFGAGRIAITSDLPQNRHYDPTFCWRVPTEPLAEAEALIGLMERAVAEPEAVRAAGSAARDYVLGSAAWPVVAEGYRDALARIDIERTGRRLGSGATSGATTVPVSAGVTEQGAVGVNVFTDLRADTGLAESARRHAVALSAVGVDLTVTEFNSRAPSRTTPVPPALADQRSGKDYPVDLWMLNFNEFHLIADEALDRYTIGLWAWELPAILDTMAVQLARLDELWVLSSFVAEAFATATDIPITVIPSVVDMPACVPDRARFGLADEAVVVLFTFSAASSDARKNPWAAIDAFRAAFGPQERGRHAQLVIKVTDLESFPELAARLTEEIASVNGVLVNTRLDRPAMNTLLASCDIYLSLHRSEGFGLGMAEAMALGKSVVATAYGGNLDFMPPDSAALVGYEPRTITSEDHRFGPRLGDWYRPGQQWAEPNVRQAARWLRALADDPGLRRSMGAAAMAAISAHSGERVVGAAMRHRLAQIDPDRRLARRSARRR